ncbi:MAG: type II secretion system protein [SAR324 cluster bacterium]|nr:type II secretion system protein [SAR324 cluster bacterium]
MVDRSKQRCCGINAVRNLLGFTFIEIMIVMVLFSLLASLAAPEFFSAFEKTSQAELRKLVRVINLLRNEAILGNNQYYIVFDVLEQKYHIEVMRKEGGRVQVDSPKLLRAHSFPEEFRLEEISLTNDAIILKQNSFVGLSEFAKESVSVSIDSSGFVTPFTLFFTLDEEIWLIQTKNIMGQLELKKNEDV